MSRFLIIPVLIFLLFTAFNPSFADVLIQDVEITSVTSQNSLFTSEDTSTGEGAAGDYILLACAVSSANGGSVFSSPTPDGWTLIESGLCGGAGTCSLGIWGKFLDTASSENINCNFMPGANIFAAGAVRYSGVDPVDPIVDSSCLNGASFGANVFALAPGIMTVDGGHAANFWAFRNFNQNLPPNNIDSSELPFDYSYIATGELTFTNLTLRSEGGGPTPDGNLLGIGIPAGLDAEWRGCTVALRMNPVAQRNVPALSEWGLIGFAAVAGIAGLFFIRRRRAFA